MSSLGDDRVVPVAHFSGDDAYAIDRAIADFARSLGGDAGPLEVWRVELDDATGTGPGDGDGLTGGRTPRILDEIAQRLATAPLFGGGTLVVVRQPGALTRGKASRERILGLIASVPEGNGLCFAELAQPHRRERTADPLREAVTAAGGSVVTFSTPTRERMERWIEARAGELGVRLGSGAASLLAQRVGAHVREGDVDRRRQTQLVNSELEKLSLYRPSGQVSRDDVGALVAEAVPGSTWAFLDAVGMRRTREAAGLAERLLREGTAIQLLVTQLHRRIRELVTTREHLATGATSDQLAARMRLQPFRARKLAEQAAGWTLGELEAALDGLLDLDLASKGITTEGSTGPISDERSALGLEVWLAQRVDKPSKPTGTGSRSGSRDPGDQAGPRRRVGG